MSERAPMPPVVRYAAVVLLCAAPAWAQERLSFNVALGGVAAGSLTLDGREEGGRYRVDGAASSRGMARLAGRLTVRAAATGRVSGNRYRPASYTEVTESRDGTRRKTMAYSGGVPRVSQDPPDDDRPDHAADPAGQAGTLDPLTIVWALFRSRPRELACALDASSYDGARRSRIQLGGAQVQGDQLLCTGTYTREAGYSARELSERRRWTFRVTYVRAAADLWAVEELSLPLRFGTLRFRRR